MSEKLTITKLCKKCNTEKATSEFRKQPKARDGLYPTCKNCHDLDSEERYQKNKLKRIQQAKDWNVINPDKVKEYKSNYNRNAKNKQNPPENLSNL